MSHKRGLNKEENMLKTAEAVSLGHPDKSADFISSYILDRLIEQDKNVRYAVEVLFKDNTVILAGEVAGKVSLENVQTYVKEALREIGYTEEYAKIWGKNACEVQKIEVLNLIGKQSEEISCGVKNKGWGDQGVFVGYACQGEKLINRELFLAKKLNDALYEKAKKSDNLGLDIKTQITIDENGDIKVAIVAIPMLKEENLTDFIEKILEQKPQEIIVNGTGKYVCHSSKADCGITGRKLACDFYSTACPIGGGSPWTKDGTKADLSLNLLARSMATENLKDNDECFVYLSSCIGRKELPSATIKTIKNGVQNTKVLYAFYTPECVIEMFGLDKPIYAKLCARGISSLVTEVKHISSCVV